MATRLYRIAAIFLTAHIAIVFVSAQNSLSSADKQELLEAHNMFRGMVNPSATNMLRMVRHKYISILISFASDFIGTDQVSYQHALDSNLGFDLNL